MKILILISALFLISLIAHIFCFYYQLILHAKCNRFYKLVIGLESEKSKKALKKLASNFINGKELK